MSLSTLSPGRPRCPRSRAPRLSHPASLLVSVLGFLLTCPPAAQGGWEGLELHSTAVTWAAAEGGFWDGQHYLDGDFDGDGDHDIARIWDLGGQTQVDLLRSDRHHLATGPWASDVGGFWPGQHYLTADVDGDGMDDIVRVFEDAGLTSIDVVRSTVGGGQLERWATRQGGFAPDMVLATGDFNGDGRGDVARIWNDQLQTTLDVFVSEGSAFTAGRWLTRSGGHDASMRFIAGDFDGDGLWDLSKIFADGGQVSIDVYPSTGSAFGAARWLTRQGAWDAAGQYLAGDFSGDGRWDVARVDAGGGRALASVFLSLGNRLQRYHLLDRPSPATRWNAGDYDGDGTWEIAGLYGVGGATRVDVFGVERPVWETGAQPSSWDSGGDFGPGQHYLAGDFDGDGHPDVARVFADFGLTSIDVHLSWGSGLAHQRWATRQGMHWGTQRFVAGDVDGDGRDDIVRVFGDADQTSMDLFQSQGGSFSMSRAVTRQGPHDDTMKYVAGDFDGDGAADVAKVYDDGGFASFAVYPSAAGTLGAPVPWATRQGGFWPQQVYVGGDYDGDGHDDLARVFNDFGSVSIDLLASRSGGFVFARALTRSGIHVAGQALRSGDFDGDGRDDLVKVYPAPGGVLVSALYRSLGAEFAERPLWTGGVFSPTAVWVAADFDGDGRAEAMSMDTSAPGGQTSFQVYGDGDGGAATFTCVPWDGSLPAVGSHLRLANAVVEDKQRGPVTYRTDLAGRFLVNTPHGEELVPKFVGTDAADGAALYQVVESRDNPSGPEVRLASPVVGMAPSQTVGFVYDTLITSAHSYWPVLTQWIRLAHRYRVWTDPTCGNCVTWWDDKVAPVAVMQRFATSSTATSCSQYWGYRYQFVECGSYVHALGQLGEKNIYLAPQASDVRVEVCELR
ncbi:MAG: VCBS repeat-containing protein [Acidobacteriota bacterium]